MERSRVEEEDMSAKLKMLVRFHVSVTENPETSVLKPVRRSKEHLAA